MTIALIILDLILAAVAYFLYMGVFIPQMAKNALYAKLKAKERAEIDKQLGIQEYFGIKASEQSIDIPVTIKK